MALETSIKFIEKSTLLHKEFYDYSKVEYINAKTEVEIVCPIHGVFLQKPRYHLLGNGCIKCGYSRISKSNSLNTDIFIKNSKDKWGDKFDYKKTIYTSLSGKMIITCREHGDFETIPKYHLSGKHGGCGLCKSSKKERELDFLKRSDIIHGGIYDYSNVVFVNQQQKVLIGCAIHGLFSSYPHRHLKGVGCPSCGRAKSRLGMSRRIANKKIKNINQPEDYKLIHLGDNFFAKVDNDDFESLKKINWYRTVQGYVKSQELGLMHRYIKKTPEGMVVDHINRDKSDNRKSNLRNCTPGENVINTPVRGKSKYRGVHKTPRGKWKAVVSRGGFGVYGTFDTEIEAAEYYNKMAKEIHKEFAILNIIE